MAIDPICGMTVDEATARIAQRDGQTFYFCCEHCRQKFLADGAAVDKRATVSAFYIQQKPKPASFARMRELSTGRFSSRSSYDGNRTNVAAQKQAKNSPDSYSTSSVTKLRNAPDGQKAKDSRTFADQRPFLDRGKSQKSLDRQNPPLTIEQVRELLNKNK